MGVPLDSVRRFRATLLLHATFVHSCCTWRATCVAAFHKNQEKGSALSSSIPPSSIKPRYQILVNVTDFGRGGWVAYINPPGRGVGQNVLFWNLWNLGFHN